VLKIKQAGIKTFKKDYNQYNHPSSGDGIRREFLPAKA
jgi:hypothetical protein